MKKALSSTLTGLLLASSISLTSVPAAWAKPFGKHHGKMAAELNLSAQQQEQMKKIHSDYKESLKPKMQAMKAAQKDLEEALRSDASEEEIRKKFDVLNSKQNEFAKARFEKILAIRAILTPEQRQKFKGLRPHRKGFGKHGFHMEDE